MARSRFPCSAFWLPLPSSFQISCSINGGSDGRCLLPPHCSPFAHSGACLSRGSLWSRLPPLTTACSGWEPAVQVSHNSRLLGGWLPPLMLIVRQKCARLAFFVFSPL